LLSVLVPKDFYCLADLERQLLIDEFTTLYAAEEALARRVRVDPDEASRLGILCFDETGRQLGAPIRMPPLSRRGQDLAR
jgi:hypothetical protein